MIRKKLIKTAGFTLAETLMTVLILTMVAGVVAGGIPAAVNAYSKAVDAANAHALLSTTIGALRDEFSTAWNVECSKETDGTGGESGGGSEAAIDKKTIVTYYNSDTGARTRLYMGKEKDTDTNKTIMVQDYLAFDADAFADNPKVQVDVANNPPHTLVSASAVTSNLSISYESVKLEDDSVVVFNKLYVTNTKTKATVAKVEELKIRLLSTNLVIPEAAAQTAVGP